MSTPPGDCAFFELGQIKFDEDGNAYECEFTTFFGLQWVIIFAR